MPWIGGAQAAKKTEPLQKAPTSLEFATTVSTRGIAPANAVIEQLTAAECRFRTVVFFDIGDLVEFEFGLDPHQKVFARGAISGRAQNGPRFIYQMRLTQMTAKEVDALARAVADSQRRQAAARSHERLIRQLPTTEQLTRGSLRIATQFQIQYRTPKSGMRDARCNDVSAGGMLMVCAEALVEGEPVELQFTLPSDVLKVFPEETVAIDLSKGTVKSLGNNNPRRPFKEMTVGARVVNHRPLGNGLYTYGLAFTCIDGHQTEEIARYTHAVHRARNRH